MSIPETQNARILNISIASSVVLFPTAGNDSVWFQTIPVNGASVGSLALAVRAQIAPGKLVAPPTGAVVVPVTGAFSSSVTVIAPEMGVYITTAGTSGAIDIYMHGRAAV